MNEEPKATLHVALASMEDVFNLIMIAEETLREMKFSKVFISGTVNNKSFDDMAEFRLAVRDNQSLNLNGSIGL